MEMTLRWYGSKFDTVTLKQIRQIPGVTGVITTLYDTQPGEVWDRERIRGMKDEVEASGLHIAGLEMRSRPACRKGSNISIIISKHLRIWGRKISIWYATTSCRCLTGRARNWRV